MFTANRFLIVSNINALLISKSLQIIKACIISS